MACERTESDACWRIEFLVRSAVSFATSTSRIRDSAAERFSDVAEMLRYVLERRFWTAPRLPRKLVTESIAVSMRSRAAVAFETDVRSKFVCERPRPPSVASRPTCQA